MPKRVRDPETGLSPPEQRFAVELAKGQFQTAAYRIAFDTNPATKTTTIASKASTLAKNSAVQSVVFQLLSEARITDIDNVGRAWKDMLDALEEARAEKNYTAVAAFTRLRLTGLGSLEHNIHIRHSGLSDTQIITHLAGGDDAKWALLHEIIGDDGFEDDDPSIH